MRSANVEESFHHYLKPIVDRSDYILGREGQPYQFCCPRLSIFECPFVAGCQDGSSIADIASGTGLAWRTIQEKLYELAAIGAIDILGKNRDRALVQIPPRYWLPPTTTNAAAAVPVSVPELVCGLCGHRLSEESGALMLAAAENDEVRLRHCLQNFFRQGKRWGTLELLVVAVQTAFLPG